MGGMPEGNTGNSQQHVGTELKRVREAAGLSQEQMAVRLGMLYAPGGRKVSTGRAAVSAWERGRRTPPAEYLQVYLDLGGNPAILGSRPDPWPPEVAIGAPTADPVTEDEPFSKVVADPIVASRPRAWRGLRWRRAALLLTVGAAAIGIGVFFAAFHSGPQWPASTWTETTGTPAHTWGDPTQLTGAGAPLGPRQSIQVLCRVRGYIVQDGDPWWYLIASAPWNGHFYATSDAFYNNGATSGSVDTGVVVDEQVPVCHGT
jgi:transcriptional regulator with XRE-family HTH domain